MVLLFSWRPRLAGILFSATATGWYNFGGHCWAGTVNVTMYADLLQLFCDM